MQTAKDTCAEETKYVYTTRQSAHHKFFEFSNFVFYNLGMAFASVYGCFRGKFVAGSVDMHSNRILSFSLWPCRCSRRPRSTGFRSGRLLGFIRNRRKVCTIDAPTKAKSAKLSPSWIPMDSKRESHQFQLDYFPPWSGQRKRCCCSTLN